MGLCWPFRHRNGGMHWVVTKVFRYAVLTFQTKLIAAIHGVLLGNAAQCTLNCLLYIFLDRQQKYLVQLILVRTSYVVVSWEIFIL